MIPKDTAHLLSDEAGSRVQDRSKRCQPKAGGGGWRKEGPVPTHHVWSQPLWDTGGTSRCPTALSPTFSLAELPRLSSTPITPGTSEWSLKARLFPPTPICPTLNHPSQHPGVQEGSFRVPARCGSTIIWLNSCQCTPNSPACTKGVRAGTEPGGADNPVNDEVTGLTAT